jgi:hypothetical protein
MGVAGSGIRASQRPEWREMIDCPKCGVPQAEERGDCVACGIIFDRYRASQKRDPSAIPSIYDPSLAPTLPDVSGHDDSIRLPRWAVGGGVALFVLLGILWTIHRHTTRAHDADALDVDINEINRRGIAPRGALRDLRQKRITSAGLDREAEARRAAGAAVASLWAGLPQDDATRMIERTDAMKAALTVMLPKEFTKNLYNLYLERYPALFPAVRDGVVEFDPPLASINRDPHPGPVDYRANTETIRVNLTSRGRAPFSSGADGYVATFGSRRVTAITGASSVGDHAYVQFTWTFPDEVGNALCFDRQTGRGFSLTGSASLVKEGTWRIESVVVR